MRLIQDNIWKDIDLAPKDGTEIIIKLKDRPKGKDQVISFWNKEINQWVFFEQDQYVLALGDMPTHFRPLVNDNCAIALEETIKFINLAIDLLPQHHHLIDNAKLVLDKLQSLENE